MERRMLGRTGIEVSEIGCGCVEIGMPYGIGVEDESQILNDSAAVELLRRSLAARPEGE
jgi:aryl-alcohol dehydrogenase-like predicted oxidoreductase